MPSTLIIGSVEDSDDRSSGPVRVTARDVVRHAADTDPAFRPFCGVSDWAVLHAWQAAQDALLAVTR